MSKSKVARVKHELVNQVEKDKYEGLSELVLEETQHRLQKLAHEGILASPEGTRIVGVKAYTCTNDFVHHVKVVKYSDSSVWVMCPMFGWFEDAGSRGIRKLGCKERKKRCTWFIG